KVAACWATVVTEPRVSRTRLSWSITPAPVQKTSVLTIDPTVMLDPATTTGALTELQARPLTRPSVNLSVTCVPATGAVPSSKAVNCHGVLVRGTEGGTDEGDGLVEGVPAGGSPRSTNQPTTATTTTSAAA